MKKRIITIIIALLAIITISFSAFAENIDTTKIGDVNGDSKITASDARIVLRVAAHLEPETENIQLYGDINKDKKITASDARTILRIAANLENIDCIIHGHDLTKKIIEATCTAEGYTTNSCVRCSYTDGTKTNIMPMRVHGYRFDSSVKATCTTEGYDLYKCIDCGHPMKKNIQPKTGHSFKKGSVIKGTCVSDGYTEYKCSTCGIVEKRDITKAGGHKYEYISKERYETPKFIGYKAIKKCAYCGKVIETYDSRTGNSQIEMKLTSSSAAIAIINKFDKPIGLYPLEGYDITGIKVVVYNDVEGLDADGYYYNLDGTRKASCPFCFKPNGIGKGMCDTSCRLIVGGV